ncbi:MAG TPA: hypothetical protein VFH42_03730, partial [Sporolactobacillaceae bacterium]|nr:hypothetical protein [Sporolactobacillaceae bacterium]
MGLAIGNHQPAGMRQPVVIALDLVNLAIERLTNRFASPLTQKNMRETLSQVSFLPFSCIFGP